MASGLIRPAGQLDAAGSLAPYRGTWNDRLAAHLLRRAGFGGAPDEIGHYASLGVHEAVQSLIHVPDASNVPGPNNVYDPRLDLFMLAGTDDMTRRAARQRLRMQQVESVRSMQTWWLNRMLTTPAPLQEKMAFLFHGHFTSAAVEKGIWPTFVYAQNQLFRKYALGNLRDLTLEVSKDPAMLLYLDNASSNKAHPNENYARELMELFTLGHGNYTEEDIRQSARAFTGWTVNRREGAFVVNRQIHDDGVKTFLGRSGAFDGGDIVNIIYQQPASARFWATTLLGAFVYNDPEPELVAAVATLIRKHDFWIAPVMSTLLSSNVFYSPRAYRALVKSPVEFVVGAYKAFGLQQIDPSSLRALNQMGQILFHPPNVAGWPGGQTWLTSQSMIARANFLAALVNSPMMRQSSWIDRTPMDADRAAHELVYTILQGDAPDQSFAQIISYLDGDDTSALRMLSAENFQERVRGAAYLTMAMPAYQLA
jgi:uncharacterized protein (DUF1800 family)